ncbi:MAG: hypothetical protein WC975_13735 [Phycisphaerae bacterium]
MTWWTKEPLRVVELVNGWDFDAITLKGEAEAISRLGGNVRALRLGKTLKTKTRQGKTTLTLPVLNDYEVIECQ